MGMLGWGLIEKWRFVRGGRREEAWATMYGIYTSVTSMSTLLENMSANEVLFARSILCSQAQDMGAFC
jgi:hypothetical protein